MLVDPSPAEPTKQLEAACRERDLYRQLLELGAADDIEVFLADALSLIVGVTGARCGYFEIRGDRPHADGPQFHMARGCSDEELEQIRGAISTGIIAESLATNATIVTASALLDPRFQSRGSVRRNRIEAVLCTPVGNSPALGVLYLQGRREPGPFPDEARAQAETFARHAATFADRLLLRRQQSSELDPTLAPRQTLRAEGVVGRSPALAKVLRQVAQVAPLEISVLLTGPSGSGKTQLARLIHDHSPRARGPFVELNCAAIPEALLENELFGAEAGGHSTAAKPIVGKVSAAAGGTLFLDEVAELRPAVQKALLQLLQSKEYFPLGAAQLKRADVRVVAATNADLKLAVARKEFREDLYFRLHVLPIRMPPLSERREDIAELARFFCRQACEEHHLPELTLSAGALRAAETAEWPGNVRELAHAIQVAALQASLAGVLHIERSHLFPDADEAGRPGAPPMTFQTATRQFQKQLLLQTLEDAGWNVTETAQKLDLTRAHVYNLLRAFGIERRPSS